MGKSRRLRRAPAWLLAGLVCTLASTSAGGQQPPLSDSSSLEQRVRDLEGIVQKLQREATPNTRPASLGTPVVDGSMTPDAGQIAPSHPIPLESDFAPGTSSTNSGKQTSGWDNGFYLRSDDGAYRLRITGQIQADVHDYLRHTDLTDISTFLVRRARLGIEATVYNYFEFRLLPDFGQGKTTIQDAYLNVHYIEWFQIAGGKLKEPVSYEQLIQDRFVPTVERSLIDQLVPGRDVGFMIHGGELFGNQVGYAVGIFNGDINGDQDTNGHKDLAWRVSYQPFDFSVFPEALHLLQIGISGTTGIEQEPINPPVLHTPASVPYFTFNSTVRAEGLRNRWSPEVAYFYGGLGLTAQYYYETQQMSPVFGSKTVVTVPFEGYYVMATYLVTGESRTHYSQAVVPKRNYDPMHPIANPGAWELVARFSRLDVGDVVFAPGAARLANPATSARDAYELTIGFNWYLNAWVRTQFNWEHARFGSPVPLGAGIGGMLRGQDTILARLQVIF